MSVVALKTIPAGSECVIGGHRCRVVRQARRTTYVRIVEGELSAAGPVQLPREQRVRVAGDGSPTPEELDAARKRLAPYLAGYPEPMIDVRRLRIANGNASEQDVREIAAEDAVLRTIRGEEQGHGGD